MSTAAATPRIPKGYYLKARCIEDSAIAHFAPSVRETWDWLLRNANHKDCTVGSKIIKRGQLLVRYEDIQEGLSWHVGWRKRAFSRHQIEHAMKTLRNATMIATKKTTRGMIVTVVNYAFYQDPSNYERHTEHRNEPGYDTTLTPHYKQEGKNGKNVSKSAPPKAKPKSDRTVFNPPTLEEVQAYIRENNLHVNPDEFFHRNEAKGWVVGKTNKKMENWRSAVQTWEQTWKKENPGKVVSNFGVNEDEVDEIVKAYSS